MRGLVIAKFLPIEIKSSLSGFICTCFSHRFAKILLCDPGVSVEVLYVEGVSPVTIPECLRLLGVHVSTAIPRIDCSIQIRNMGHRTDLDVGVAALPRAG
jgi:hypothetical protein